MKRLNNRSLAAELGLVFVTMIWGSAFVVVKNATETVPAAFLIFFRFAIACVLMAALFFRRLKGLTVSDFKRGLFVGGQTFLAFELQTIGVKQTTAGKNAFLTAAYCVVVPFLWWAVRKIKPRRAHLVSAFLCLVGIGLLSLQKGEPVNWGDVLSFSCSFLFAAQIVTIGILTETCDPIRLCFTQTAVTAGLALITALFTEPLPDALPADTVFSLLYLGVFSTMLANLLQYICQKYTAPSKASLIMSLESVFGTAFGILFLSEKLTLKTLAGFVLIFISIVLSERKPHSSGNDEPHPAPVPTECGNSKEQDKPA